MFLILGTIVLFVIYVNPVKCSEVLGNYTNISAFNDKSCGISLFSSELKGCFKYHKELPLNMKGSRNAISGESPWAVFIVTKGRISVCGGVLITNQWVMTAAHCLQYPNGRIKQEQMLVHLNPVKDEPYLKLDSEYRASDSRHVHHKFVYNPYNPNFAFDIGLFKLNKPIEIKSGVVNTICLPPERNFLYFEEQYAMYTGWHSMPLYNVTNQLEQLNQLQIDTMKVSSHTNIIYKRNGKDIPANVVDKRYYIWPGYIFGKRLKSTLCKGDSGSPVWQYYLGRAVLIGIFSETDKGYNRCQREIYIGYFPNQTAVHNLNETLSQIVWVPMIMDWVKNIILNN